MPKKTRNILISAGVIAGVFILGLRIYGQLMSPGEFGIISDLLGYEGVRTYAVLFEEKGAESSYAVFLNVENGTARIIRVFPLSSIRLTYGVALPDAAKIIGDGYAANSTSTVSAVGFVTANAVGQILKTLKGVSVGGIPLNGTSLSTFIAGMATSTAAINSFNQNVSVKTSSLIAGSPALLATAKNIFSQGEAGMYFISESPLGKQCVGACDKEWAAMLNLP